MVTELKRLPRNRNFILFLALALGLLWDRGAQWTQELTLPALALVMTLSTMGVSGSVFRYPRTLFSGALPGILMNYVVLGSFILGTSILVIREGPVWDGFVILAAVPPAVAVLPFSDMLRGDSTYSLLGTIGAYLGALIIMPLITIGFLGADVIDRSKLTLIMAELIVVPLVFSRILIWTRASERIAPFRGTITNWGFFTVVYTIVALNRDIFLHQPLILIPVGAIAFASTFLLGFLIDRVARLVGLDSKTSISMVLLGTLKNYGLAGGVSLSLFSQQTAVPATVSCIFMILYVIWLGYLKK